MGAIVTDIYVYADWVGLAHPTYIGKLSAQQSKGKETYSFEYDKAWIRSAPQFILDPELQWHASRQYPARATFGIFLDSMPDRWGRVLMNTRAAQKARAEDREKGNLLEVDYLLGVDDSYRMGALRFKRDKEGPFLDNNPDFPTPPWTSLKELQYSAKIVEEGTSAEISKHLARLIAPGSSLGGARPKANILDNFGHPWIAKFPAQNDTYNKGAWEFVAHQLARAAKINMSDCKMLRVAGTHDTFLTKRFDRIQSKRVHFASAMTMTEQDESSIKGERMSYLDLATFIQYDSKASAAHIKADLHELWRRIVFNIAISNTDDHLRNHGFIIAHKEWRLSPAYDLNPSTKKQGLSLNIDADDNALNFDLAKEVAPPYFKLSTAEMELILDEVKEAVQQWRAVATRCGLSKKEQDRMQGAFWW